MGYGDEAIRGLCRQAHVEGWTHFKVKVGGKPADDRTRVSLVRDAIGPNHKLMIDANQEHGVLGLRSGSAAAFPDLHVGDQVRILPNHACATASQHDAYQVTDEARGVIMHVWPRFGGW